MPTLFNANPLVVSFEFQDSCRCAPYAQRTREICLANQRMLRQILTLLNSDQTYQSSSTFSDHHDEEAYIADNEETPPKEVPENKFDMSPTKIFALRKTSSSIPNLALLLSGNFSQKKKWLHPIAVE